MDSDQGEERGWWKDVWKCKKKTCTFVSLITNAFDRVKHDMLFEILSKAEINKHNLYLQQKATERYENETSEEITIKRGFRQSCIIVTMFVQHLHGILEKRSTEGWKGNKRQWKTYHKHQICR